MFADPAKNVSHFGLIDGMVVCDFGAGSGAYVMEMARKVGHSGKVYAVDVQRELLDRIERQARDFKLRNIYIAWGNVERVGGSKLADNSADLVLLSNLLFQVEGKYTTALETKRVLKPGGRAVVIDWTDSFGGLGPQQSQVVMPESVKEIFSEAGLIFKRDFPAGEHHYGLIFNKKS